LAALEPLTWEGGWSAVLPAPETRTDEAWTLALLERGVLVQPGHFFDFADEHHLIVSLLTEPETFARGARIMAATLA
jgi:aspartate/methionine/tyrosine aminotransferase